MKSIKYWRLERQFSQLELALASGMPRYKIQQFEEGIRRPVNDELTALSEALGVEESILSPDPMKRTESAKIKFNRKNKSASEREESYE